MKIPQCSILDPVRQAIGFLLFLGLLCPAAAVEISGLEVGNVTPSSFTAVWQVSADSQPALELFADVDESLPPAGDPVIEFFPLDIGDPDLPGSTVGDRDRRRLLRDALRAGPTVLVRVTGLVPETSYFIKPGALDSSGSSVATGEIPRAGLTTPAATAFVAEARQLLVDLGEAPDGPLSLDGAVVRLSTPSAAFPLYAVVGDAMGPGYAWFDLANLVAADGLTNAILSGTQVFDLAFLDGSGEAATASVNYDGSFVVADSVAVPFVLAGTLGGFAFDPISTQEQFVNFDVTIRALDTNGDPIPDFTGTVDISSIDGTLQTGAGTTAAFTNGVLRHTVAFSDFGTRTLTATATGGAETGTSAPFTVAEQVLPPTLGGFAFDLIGPQEAGVPFAVTLRALDTEGAFLSTFTGTVEISSSTGTLSEGGGQTAAFVAGVLRHTMTFSDTGSQSLTATLSGGTISGASNEFEVFAVPPTLAGFTFDSIGTQEQNVPFPVTIRAVDSNGVLLTAFDGSVDISSATGTLTAGSGTTPAFVNGVLADYEVALAEAGEQTLTASLPSSDIASTSASFTVQQLLRTLSIVVDPDGTAVVTGAGSYENGSTVAISVTPNDGFRFRRWQGDGVANPRFPETTVLMDQDRQVTALISEIGILTFEDWIRLFSLKKSKLQLLRIADPDGDNVVNLLEFALGRNPVVADFDGGRLPVLALDGEGLILTFFRLRSNEPVTYILEQAGSAGGPWSTLSYDPNALEISVLDEQFEAASLRIPNTGEQKFFRLRVELANP